MSIDIRLKHSATANKAPQPADLKDGELALNTNAASPAAYIKDSAGNIVKLAGDGSVGSTPWTRGGGGLIPTTAADNVFVGGTASSPNIALNANGSATYTAQVRAGTSVYTGNSIRGVNNSATEASVTGYNYTSAGPCIEAVDSAGIRKAVINADGSAEFAGSHNGQPRFLVAGEGQTFINSSATKATTKVFTIKSGGSSTEVASIAVDGSATFAGSITVGPVPIAPNPTTSGATLYSGGQLYLSRASANEVALYIYKTGEAAAKILLLNNGSATFAGTVTATVVPPSDTRFKENITPANPQLADVVALGKQLKNFDWNDKAPLNDELRAVRQLGLIAQEAERVSPGIVKTIKRTKQGKELTPEKVIPAVYKEVVDPQDEENFLQELVTPEQIIPATYEEVDDSFKGISHDALIMKLLGAVAELSAEVEALKAAK